MIHRTQVSYFDGLTSTPHITELTLDDAARTLKFAARDGNRVSVDMFEETVLEAYNGNLRVRFKDSDAQIIIEDAAFADELKKLIRERSGSGIYQKLMNLKFGTHVLIAVSLIPTFIALYVFAAPFVAGKAVGLIPVTFDIQLGDAASGDIFENKKVDSAKTKLLNEFASSVTWDNTIDLKFYVIDSPTENAFALPNGKIAVFSGLLDKIDDSDALFALLAHEVVHVNRRHSMQAMCRTLTGTALISILTANTGGLTSGLAQNAGQLGNLSYSRKMESEADDGAIALLEKNSIDPNGMVKLMEILQNITENGFMDNVDFLSSHPATERRIKNARSKIPAKKYIYEKDAALERVFEEIRKRR